VFEGDDDEDVAQAWTIKYEENSREAMKELVNFILKVCHPRFPFNLFCAMETNLIVTIVLRLP